MSNKQIALVTGAAHGIGFETCRQVGRKEFTIVLTGRDAAKGESAAQTLAGEGLDVAFLKMDVTDEDSVKSAAGEIKSRFGGLDVLINNAAAYADWQETASNADLAHAHAVFETNLFGAWRTAQIFLPLITERKGRIINVSSGAGSHGDPAFGLTTNPGSATYAVSKAALTALTTKLALAVKDDGVLVYAVCPGLTATAPGMEQMGARPIPDGAASVVWAVTADPQSAPTGGIYRDGKPLPW